MTDDPAGTRPARQRPFALLVRSFFHGLFESDLLPDDGDLRQSLLWVGAIVLTPMVWISVLVLYVGFRPRWWAMRQAELDGTLGLLLVGKEQLSWGVELLFIFYAMTVVGFITVMVWDRVYPDRRDVMVLGTLPVRERTVFGAKLPALLLLVVAVVVAISLPSAVAMAIAAGIARRD